MRYTNRNLNFGIGFYHEWAIGIMYDHAQGEGFHLALGPFAIWWFRA